jgi:DNA-directed RNA polymerase alpha subunit
MELTVVQRVTKASTATLQISNSAHSELMVLLQQIIDLQKEGFKVVSNPFEDLKGKSVILEKEEVISEEPKEEITERPVEEVEFSVRAYNLLKGSRIDTVGQLLQKSEADLLKTKNFGRKSINDIKEVLATMNLSLRPS